MIPHRLVLAVFFSATILCGAAQQWPNFCAQARQMHNECRGYETAAISGPEGVGRVGRPGPRGPPGLVGKPGLVNYTAIDEEMKKKFEGMESKIEEKFLELVKYEEKVNRTFTGHQRKMESKFEEKLQELVRYEEKVNRTMLEHQQRMNSKIEARIEELARYEEKLDQTSSELVQLKRELDSETEARLQQIIENEEKINQTMERVDQLDIGLNSIRRPGCTGVSPENAKIATEGGGVYDVKTRDLKQIEVFCDMQTDGGGWTVFQRRMDGSVNFNRNWDDYVRGFGNKTGEFWLGLEALHQMTKDEGYELRVELTDKAGATAYAKYGSFSIAGSEDNYRLTVGQYSGTAGDSLAYHANGMFSAPDRDHDTWGGGHCAANMKGAWWFKYCQHSHLNGEYSGTGAYTAGGRDGLYWRHWRNRQSLKATEMKFRKKLI